MFNEAGTQVVWYDYDAWGNRVGGAWVVNDQDIYKNLYYSNPFGYRGYYLDTETGFYYCGSRYYDPVIGRFINADNVNTLMNTPMAYTDKNLYAYCDNNPVMRVDNGGEFWDTVFDVVSLCFSVVDVVKNPDDPWAWVDDSIHRGFSYEYNEDWYSFLHAVEGKLPSYSQIIEFGKMMAKKYGFDILF